VDLALGQELDVSQWVDRTELLLGGFLDGYGPHLNATAEFVNGVPVLLVPERRGAAVVIGHPLWRHDEDNWNPRVRVAVSELRDRGLSGVTVSDAYVLDRTPMKIFSELVKAL
jgi:DEAD/DEAH box helicase domain-containing protein